MEKLCFATPAAFDAAGFGCATLSPIMNGAVCESACYPQALHIERLLSAGARYGVPDGRL